MAGMGNVGDPRIQQSTGLNRARGRSERFGSFGDFDLKQTQGVAENALRLKTGLVKRNFAATLKLRLFEALEKTAVQRVLDSMRSEGR